MEPISLILLAVGMFGGATVAGIVVIAYLTITDVLSWFRARRQRLSIEAVAATVLQRMADGQYRTVQGVFNTRTKSWTESRTIDSERIDTALAARHRYSDSVIYNI